MEYWKLLITTKKNKVWKKNIYNYNNTLWYYNYLKTANVGTENITRIFYYYLDLVIVPFL